MSASTSRGSGAGNGVPAAARKLVQSLKEIVVGCSDAEIYVVLKECNMDADEAVNRLLSQDSFHEVKSKREKKKEGRENYDYRTHGANNSSARRSRNGADRHIGRGASASHSASESAMHGKPIHKKENGSAPYESNFSSAAGVSRNNRRSQGSSAFRDSDGSSAEAKESLLGTTDGLSSVVHTTSGHQSTRMGVPGQISMADIVRMGRPLSKASHAPSASHLNIQDTSAAEPFPCLRSADLASKVNQSEVSSFQHVHGTDEWHSVENPAPTNVVYDTEYTVDAQFHPEESGATNGFNLHYEEEEVQEREDDNVGNTGRDDLGSVSIPNRKISEDDSRGSPLYENEFYQNLASYKSEAPDYEHRDGEGVGVLVSSISRNLEQLTIEKDDKGLPSEDNTPTVVIPDHLQVQAADFSHLSFGSFGCSLAASNSSGTLTSAPVKINLEEGHNRAEVSLTGHVDTSQSEHYIADSLRNTHDRFHRNGPNGATAGTYDPSSAPQPEELKPESAEVARRNLYPFPSANPGYNLDDAQSVNPTFNETSSQMQNLAQFSSVMQSYTNSLPSTLLTGNVHSARESDHQYSPFSVSHAMTTEYGNSVSSIAGSAISMSEALKTANSSTLPVPQSLSGTSVATGPALPQQVAVHQYSQPTHPLGPFANMIGYPFLPQSYSYMPSAFQQSFAGNSTYNQSLAALLPQYKSSVSVSSLPQSASVPSGYGGLGSANSIPGNYLMNPTAAPSGSALNYDDVLSSQYKESSHLLSLQQNENPAMWLNGQGSRTAQAVPSSAYYNYQGQQTQQLSGFRQQVQQQQSQNYGAPGYPNFYHSQKGISLDQQQNPRDGTLGASQGQPKPSQIWLNGY